MSTIWPHILCTFYQVLLVIGIQLVVEGQLYYSDNPYSYFHDQSWEHALYTVLNCSMTWVGQALLVCGLAAESAVATLTLP